MAFDQLEHLDSPTGATLALRREPARDQPKGVIMLCHGLAEHCGRYLEFARFLAGRGYHVYAHDHRGHGHTRAQDAVPGRFAWSDGARRVVEDLIAVRTHVRACHPQLPVILFGHSMGGMIATRTVERYPADFAGLAVWNADLNPGLAGRAGIWLLRLERFLKGSDVPSHYAPRLTFEAWARAAGDGRSPFCWLSRDSREVDAYAADPLCGFAPSVSMWLDVLAIAIEAGRQDSLTRLPKGLPVHLVGGGHDPATRNGEAMRWLAQRMAALGMRNVELQIHADMRHETLKEFGRHDAMKAFAAWADGVVDKASG